VQAKETRPTPLFFSIAVTTFGTAFYIMLLVGFAWLVRASFS